MKRILLIATFIGCSLTTQAQTFSSGSTGADGALDLASGDREVQLPESGILNYTTVNIPAGKTLKFKKNSRNTPVILLAQGAVTIGGSIEVSVPYPCLPYCQGDVRVPGPGGFYGGAVGQAGFGPGGGQGRSSGFSGDPGKWVGPLSLVPLIGGSGAGGYADPGSNWVGGGGGGAIAIASSTSIVLSSNSTIVADGRYSYGGQSGGSGGAIRLVANSLTVNGTLSAKGGNPGLIRLEAPQGALAFAGTSDPPPVLSSINSVIVSTAVSLAISSIGGFPVPSATASRPDVVDLMLPKQLSDPIPLVIQARNIPVGTQVKVNISGAGSATTGTLGPDGRTTINISGLDKGGAITYLYAYAVFDLPQSVQNFNLKGKDEIAQVRIEAAPGTKAKYVFLRKDGSEVERGKVPPQLLQQFGGLE